MDLFSHHQQQNIKTPLADRMRPQRLFNFIGQEEILGKNKILRKAIELGEIPSMIFWGPPGSGKTTLARIIANEVKANFVSFSAVSSGVKEIREVVKKAKEELKFYGRKTILFIDEIHRFNKAQQDAFLPYVEDGTIILIGATTENPSFEINTPLLSRTRVFVLKPHTIEDLKKIISRTLQDKENGLGKYKIKIEPQAIEQLICSTNGDARIVLNALELAIMTTKPDKNGFYYLTKKIIEEALQHKALAYDRAGDEHYNVISAFIKSLRGSDPDAALYWLARMLEAGEDPLFIARRMVIFASEDIGNADPQALGVAVACMQAVDFVGMPEAQINLAHAVTYLASAPKSNASYIALLSAREEVKKTLNLPVPLHLRNASTKLAEELNYGKNYKYPHDFGGYVKQDYLPKELSGKKFYPRTNPALSRKERDGAGCSPRSLLARGEVSHKLAGPHFPKEIGFEKNIKEKRKV